MRNFSLWVDYLDRGFLADGLDKYLGSARGITTNPAIFKAAFGASKLYEKEIADLKKQKLNAKKIYETLAIVDVRNAADKLRPFFNKVDGFVSIEVDPAFAKDAASTIEEAKRLYKAIGRENVMIKIPATSEGFIAIRELLLLKIPTNATLIFAPDQTKRVLRAAQNCDTPLVISVFVSRFDRAIDEKISEKLRLKTGIMNAANHYNLVQNSGVKNARILFASTGVKGANPAADYYIRELAGENSINTAPLNAIDRFINGVAAEPKLPIAQGVIDDFFAALESEGIDFGALCDLLLAEGLAQFEAAFLDILRQF
ncbi:transaldolase [Campylobacterota bacterium]|nr:transaldolase [Campylobacterota bacterium]